MDEKTSLYSKKFISMLRCRSLESVMAANGHYPVYEDRKRSYYRCPFHNDNNPSFSLEREGAEETGPVQRFNCPGCKVSGAGALDLQALFMGKSPDSDEVIAEVARIFGIVPYDREDADHYSRRSEAEPQDEYSFEYNDTFTDRELEALGCRRRPAYEFFVGDDGETIRQPRLDAQGKPVYLYSWGDGYYEDANEDSGEVEKFDRTELTRVFGLRSVKSFVTSARTNTQGELKSYRIRSSESYPIFTFVYGEDERQWGKKYEPCYREGHKGIKFMFWKRKHAPKLNLGAHIYGDIDVVNYLESGDVNDIHETKRGKKAEGLFTHTEEDREGNTVSKKVFHHLVICSGPRDAINIYFHSTAHVVWFNSECDFSHEVYRRLKACCEHLYVCYDIDNHGVEMSNQLAIKHLGLRIIRLPKSLSRYTDRRTGKQGKDAENFFNLYREDIDADGFRFYGNIEMRFDMLMRKANDLRFFTEVWRERKVKKGEKTGYINYEISGNSAIQLASARNIYRYNLSDTRHIYVRCTGNIVDIIPDKDIVREVRRELKKYVEVLPGIKQYQKLCDTITKSNNLDKGTCEQLDDIDLSLHSWDEDTEYFPFQNTVVRVTKGSITVQPYAKAPFQFFRQGLVEKVSPSDEERRTGKIPYQNEFTKVTEPTFRIVRNTEGLKAKREEIEALMTRGMSDDEREVLESRYLEYEQLWGWKLVWLQAYETQPAAVRFVYETGRIHWEKEKRGIKLSPAEQQEQDLHFIVKCNAFGYLLSRHRDPARAYIVQWTDYTSMAEGRSSGQTGKSTLAGLLNCLRNVLLVPGKEIKTRENFSKNFSGFRVGVHSNITIDDLDLRIDEEQFYNMNTNLQVKTLYEDEYIIPADECPKVQITSNRKPKMDSSSTAGRFMMVPVGGPIGHHFVNGRKMVTSVSSLFGVNMPNGLSRNEYTFCQNFLMQCLQFWFTHKALIEPFMGREGLASMAAQQVNNRDFVVWANEYFSDDSHFGCPLPRREMFLDYMEYCGKEVNIYGNNMAMNEFKVMLRKYCEAYRYVLMPGVCYRNGESDRKDESIRLNSWVTQKDKQGFRVRPRQWVWAKNERCIYVFRSNEDVPGSYDELLKPDVNCPPLTEEEE